MYPADEEPVEILPCAKIVIAPPPAVLELVSTYPPTVTKEPGAESMTEPPDVLIFAVVIEPAELVSEIELLETDISDANAIEFDELKRKLEELKLAMAPKLVAWVD